MAKIQKGLLLRDDYSKYYADRSPETATGTIDTSGFLEWQLEQDVSIIINYNLIQDLSIYVDGIAGVSISYVDGSLAARDASITQNIFDINILDASIIRLDGYNAIQDVSINQLFSESITGAVNVGDGSAGVFAGVIDGSIKMRELVGVGAAVVAENGDVIEISLDASFSGEVNTASNIGSGVGIFSNKVSQDLEFKTIGSSSGEIIIISDASNVYLDTSIAQDPSILSNINEIAQLDASITDINAYNLIQDISIIESISEISQLDASIVRIDNYDAIQDASIAIDVSFFGLSDVSIISPLTNDDIFTYNSTTENLNNAAPVDALDFFHTKTYIDGSLVTIENRLDILDVSASPGGVATNIQYNADGSFGGDSDLVWNDSLRRMGIGTNLPDELLHVKLGDVKVEDGSLFVLGNVGIGTLNPEKELHINSGVLKIGTDVGSVAGNAIIIGDSTAASQLRIGQSSTAKSKWRWVYNATAANAYADITNENGHNLIFQSTGGGRVGIGTADPSSTLHVFEAAATVSLRVGTSVSGSQSLHNMFAGSSNAGWSLINPTGETAIRLLTNTDSYINTGQFFGFGTTLPTQTLDVSGGFITNSSVNFTGLNEVSTNKILYYNTADGLITYGDNSTGASITPSLQAVTDVGASTGNRVTLISGAPEKLRIQNVWGAGVANFMTFYDDTSLVGTIGKASGSVKDMYLIAWFENVRIRGKKDVIIETGGSAGSKMIIKDDGSVGIGLPIGAPNPNYTLDIGGNINFDGSIYQNDVLFKEGADPGGVATNIQYNADGSFGGDPDLVWNDSLRRMGVGTNLPDELLHVKLGDVKIEDGSLFVLGNVGIRTSSPTQTLDVSGGFITNSSVYFTGLNEVITNKTIYYNTASGLITYGDPSSAGGVSQSYVDSSLAERDISLNYLYDYNLIQDISIAGLSSTEAWEGLTKTDNSIGLGGTFSNDILIQTTEANTDFELSVSRTTSSIEWSDLKLTSLTASLFNNYYTDASDAVNTLISRAIFIGDGQFNIYVHDVSAGIGSIIKMDTGEDIVFGKYTTGYTFNGAKYDEDYSPNWGTIDPSNLYIPHVGWIEKTIDSSIIRLDAYDAIQDISISSLVAGGVTGSIQFNDASNFAGDSDLTWSGSVLTVGPTSGDSAVEIRDGDFSVFSGYIGIRNQVGNVVAQLGTRTSDDTGTLKLFSSDYQSWFEVSPSDNTADVFIKGKSGVVFPVGTTAERPVGLNTGLIRFNSSLDVPEFRSSSAWVPISGGISQSYVDSSLAERDISLNYLFDYNVIQDISIAALSPTEAWNALTKTDNSIGLGGEILSNIDIYGESRDLYFGRKHSSAGAIRFVSSYTIDGFKAEASLGDNLGELFVGGTVGFFGRKEGLDVARYQVSTTGLEISDQIDLKGVTYQADYSANGGSDPRWIPDNAWVHATIDACAGGGGVSQAYVDSSLAERDASISQNIYEINQLDASIIRIDAYDAIQDISIAASVSQAYVDSSLAERDAEINQLDASVIRLDAYDAIQDVSISGIVIQSSALWTFDSSPGPPLISPFGRYVKTGVETLLTFRFTVPADTSRGTQVFIGDIPFISENTSFAVGSVLMIGVNTNNGLQKYQMCKIDGLERRIQFHNFPDTNALNWIDSSDYYFVGSITYINDEF